MYSNIKIIIYLGKYWGTSPHIKFLRHITNITNLLKTHIARKKDEELWQALFLSVQRNDNIMHKPLNKKIFNLIVQLY